VRFAPFLLDPTTPPEGKPRKQHTQPADPPTAIEQRAATLGITFTRGRTWTSNSRLALEAAEFAAEQGEIMRFHRAMFKAYFTDLADISDVDTVVAVGAGVGLSGDGLREALVSGRYRDRVDEGVEWSRSVGVSAVPTFILDGRYGIVGAQEQQAFEQLMGKLGRSPRA